MPETPRITHAYCEELSEVITITHARRAYFDQPEPRARFSFLCSNQSCLDMKTPPSVTGVNYASPPTETYRIAHFRNNPSDTHATDCFWMIPEEEEGPDGKLTGESEAAAKTRRIRRKLNDHITEFDPNPQAVGNNNVPGGAATEATASGGRSRKGISRGDGYSQNNGTRSFDRLVEFYRNADHALSKDELSALTLKVKGEGEMSLTSYFPSLSTAVPRNEYRVIHGGTTLEPRTGSGFMLWFYDKVNGRKVYLTVSGEQMKAYRHRGMLNQALDQTDADYFTVFALGRLVPSPTGKTFKLDFNELKQLTLIPIRKKPAA